ncbi:Beta-galactosidase-1-like protein 2 [Bagarius yarrelli]|uniref:Beta-galactosidase-1-like protein 2 n=1 Tax=Bagarius yarrelli TaxID=175774 RepID=A0A556V5J0_BAGYA|nr:Beta-galactosidase-1-like protein 2 [Bagarius yarrelli]
MVVLSVRSAHRRRYVLLILTVTGIVIYRQLSGQPDKLKINRKYGLTVNSSQFTLGGKTFRILSGSLHYFRVPQAYWKDRMIKMKACGLNTLTTYVPWNLHEPERKNFQFSAGLDLETFLLQAADLGLWVILHPGPYISSELDLGGLPSWLLRDRKMKLRTTYPGFTQAVDAFLDKLIPKLVPLQFRNGGPIIAVQVEHEYGSYGTDKKYLSFLKEALVQRGISELLLASDSTEGLKSKGVSQVLRTLNLRKLNQEDIKYLESVQPNSPVLITEYLTGHFDGWGDLHHVFSVEDMIAVVREVLRRGMSINLHMFHGGTNFGFMSGAVSNPSYKALVTSYDYDAPLSEAGEYTPKYHLLKEIFARYSNDPLPDMLALRWKESYSAAVMYRHLSLWDALPFTHEPFKFRVPINMENLPVYDRNGQAYGYTLYETTITTGGFLKSGNNIRDRALVFVNKGLIGIFDYKTTELAVSDGKEARTLSFLVENCGRVHFGHAMDNQRKGIVGDILLNNVPLRGFTIYSLDMTQSFIDNLYKARWKSLPAKPIFPAFLQGHLFVDGFPSDTFVKLPSWSKGVLFINSQNAGRYWKIGPQQALYVPGPFLNSGINQVTVFEEEESDFKLQFEPSPDLGMTVDIQ